MAHRPEMMEVIRGAMIGIVRQYVPDLTPRQLAMLLIWSLENEHHTVRGLAARLGVTKPAITLAADRLDELDLAKRAKDPRDRRSVLIVPTASGRAYVKALGAMMAQAAGEART